MYYVLTLAPVQVNISLFPVDLLNLWFITYTVPAPRQWLIHYHYEVKAVVFTFTEIELYTMYCFYLAAFRITILRCTQILRIQ